MEYAYLHRCSLQCCQENTQKHERLLRRVYLHSDVFVKVTGIIIGTLSFKLSLPWSTWGKDAHNSMDWFILLWFHIFTYVGLEVFVSGWVECLLVFFLPIFSSPYWQVVQDVASNCNNGKNIWANSNFCMQIKNNFIHLYILFPKLYNVAQIP